MANRRKSNGGTYRNWRNAQRASMSLKETYRRRVKVSFIDRVTIKDND